MSSPGRPRERGTAVKFRKPPRSCPEAVTYRSAPAAVAAGRRVITLLDGKGRDIGHVDYQVCHACGAGHVNTITVAGPWQGMGLGREALHRATDPWSAYAWSTSRQSADGRKFFAAMADETGVDFVPGAAGCPHITAAAQLL
ncbi:N-acetyltransferase [Streptomyces sp. NPDC057302]|uniref:N-acetyltransferase n=1 Tax=Streptomyces sp. NPDC057302 TaxID=3346094 RepID=UPI00362E0A6A